MSECRDAGYEDLRLGEEASFQVELTEQLIDAVASVSGDASPLHMDVDYAKTAGFDGRVAHGMIAGLWWSRLIGMQLPGCRALYLSQDLRFHHPMRPGKRFEVSGRITQKTDAAQVVVIETLVMDLTDGTICADGRALVKIRD